MTYAKYRINIENLELKYASSVQNTTYKKRNVNNNIVVWMDIGDCYLCRNIIFSPSFFGKLSLSTIKTIVLNPDIKSVSSDVFGIIPFSTYWTKWSKDGMYCTEIRSSLSETIGLPGLKMDITTQWSPPKCQPIITKLSRTSPVTIQHDEQGDWWLSQNIVAVTEEVDSWEPS